MADKGEKKREVNQDLRWNSPGLRSKAEVRTSGLSFSALMKGLLRREKVHMGSGGRRDGKQVSRENARWIRNKIAREEEIR